MKGTKYKQYTDVNAVNELDLESAMKRLENDDAELEELNLNNHKDVTLEILSTVAGKLKTNQYLKRLYIANCRITDPVAKVRSDSQFRSSHRLSNLKYTLKAWLN